MFLSDVSREKVLSGWFKAEEGAALREKTAVIPNGMDPAWLDGRAREEPSRPRARGLCGAAPTPASGRLTPWPPCMWRMTRGPGIMCCAPAEAARFQAKLCAGLREGDAFLGRVQGMEGMKAFYAGCDVLLVPSGAETFGMVYLEAMSQGVPVLYTRGQGFDGQFPEGEVGYSVLHGDVGQQARRLNEVMRGYAARSAAASRMRGSMPGRTWHLSGWISMHGHIAEIRQAYPLRIPAAWP